MRRFQLPVAAAAALACFTAAAQGQAVKVDPQILPYKSVQGVAGTIKSVGSDSMINLVTRWAEGFKKSYPSVGVETEGKGSNTAPAALISGAANFGPMSRTMKEKEIDDFEKAFGYKPTGISAAVDTLGVFVHKDNPLANLSLEQIDAIFSKTRKSGAAKDITTWGELGMTGEWANKPISLYGRNSASGTYGFFKDHALAKGDFKDTVKEQPGSSAVIQGIATDKYAIGYSGIGYLTADVRALPITAKPGGKPIAPSAETAYSGEYPLSRFLYVYINHKPGSELDPLRREFVRYILSRQGQEDVVQEGYYPLTMKLATDGYKLIGIEPPKAIEAGAPR